MNSGRGNAFATLCKIVQNRLIPFDFRWYRPYYSTEWWYSLLPRGWVVVSTLQIGAGSIP